MPDWGSTAKRRRVVSVEGLKVTTGELLKELWTSRVVKYSTVMYRNIVEHLLFNWMLLLLSMLMRSISLIIVISTSNTGAAAFFH